MITSLSVNRGGLGRFGNQIFTIASTIGIATRNGQPYGFPEWINHDNALFGGNADRMQEYFVNKLPEVDKSLNFQDIPYHWEYRDYDIPVGNYNICSHLQDPRYFEHCMPLIRETFRMKDEPPQNDYVAIHYRAGDYIDDPAAYHPRCSKEYYEQAMRLFPGGTKFVLFSDDPDSWMDKMGVLNGFCTYESGTYIDDFRVLKRCHSFICANSSFSYMAALLGEHPDKKIILPSRWFGSAANIKFEGYAKEAVVI